MRFPHLETSACADLLAVLNDGGIEHLLIRSMAKAVYCPKLACVNEIDLMFDFAPEKARKMLTALQAVPDTRDSAKLAINIQQLTNEGVPLPALAGLS